ncbi:hypothetical protein F511_37926 [Dorcoceras hygrometricum]|uniref:Uncharacterized protein n=1 Tax=Dorcoceras hygrometricum TaxID=472368 RepID=A0A2Z7A831_9LAMI|nr:hypothetical protein F511_37926 [Dorcoceras hygrometricum]
MQQSEKELKRTEPDKVVNLEHKEPGSAAASSAESVENVEDKKTEPPAADEVKEIKTYEEPKTEEPKSVAAASAESGAKIEEKKSEVPVAEEVEEKKFEIVPHDDKEPKLVDPVKDVEIETGIDKVVETTTVVEISDQVESEDTPEIKVQVKDVGYSPSGEVLERTAETKAKIIEPSDADSAEKSDIADKSSGECEGDTEKAAGSEVISRSIDLAPENEKKEETVASDETNKAAEVDDKAEKEATTTEAESKEADKTPFTESKSKEEKKDEEAVKANAQDSEETKRSQDVPKEDVPVKTQKQSNSIIKMMKHSLGKAKKAIIGKPQNSKAPAGSETRDEIASK